jgi:DNA polymerase-3 subunit beta
MKLTIGKGELLTGLTRIQSIVDKRNSMPILANVLLEAKAGKKGAPGALHLAATDLEVGIRGSHEAQVDTEGSLTASAKKLFEIVRELPEEPIELEATSNSYLTIQCQRSKFKLAGTAADEYPTLPSFSPDKTVLVRADLLASMIDRTIYSASVDETRYNLNGVYVEVLEDSGKIRMVATDGHRLARVDRSIGAETDAIASGVIIPRKGLAELKRLVDEDDADEIELAFEGNSGLARKGDVVLVMRLIEGEFPNYSQVIPSEASLKITLPSDVLTQALRRVVLFSTERSHAVQFELHKGTLVISSNSPDLGDAREELDVDYAGEDLNVGFNARYVLDALGAMRSKEITLAFENNLSPAKLVPTDDEDALAVIMPMRV